MLLKMVAKEGDILKSNALDAIAKQMGIQYDKSTYTALIACAAVKRVRACSGGRGEREERESVIRTRPEAIHWLEERERDYYYYHWWF